MQILTLVTPENQTNFDEFIASDHTIARENRTVLEQGKAVQWTVSDPFDKDTLDQIRKDYRIDILQRDADAPPIKLFMADMDSTIVKGETLDDMAERAGIGDHVKKITERAMRGELDFVQALTERVSLLSGKSTDLIAQALDDLEYNAGAKSLLTHLKNKNIQCILVSGGFTQFTGKVAIELGFDEHYGNILSTHHDALTGVVQHPVLDKNFKANKLATLIKDNNLTEGQVMAIGDGANDLPMLEAAGLGISYYGKPLLREKLINRIEYTDLSTLIYLI